MPAKNGIVAPRQRPHYDECRCLDCIDAEGNPTRPKPVGITGSAAYKAALAKAMVR
jgi:hypothetical protein